MKASGVGFTCLHSHAPSTFCLVNGDWVIRGGTPVRPEKSGPARPEPRHAAPLEAQGPPRAAAIVGAVEVVLCVLLLGGLLVVEAVKQPGIRVATGDAQDRAAAAAGGQARYRPGLPARPVVAAHPELPGDRTSTRLN